MMTSFLENDVFGGPSFAAVLPIDYPFFRRNAFPGGNKW